MFAQSQRQKGILGVIAIVVIIGLLLLGGLLYVGLSGGNGDNPADSGENTVNPDEVKNKYSLSADCTSESCSVTITAGDSPSDEITVDRFDFESATVDGRDFTISYNSGTVSLRTVVNGENVLVDEVETEYGINPGRNT